MEDFAIDADDPRPLCLYWHGVTDRRHELLDGWSISTARFRRQIDWLERHRKVVSLADLATLIRTDEGVDPRCVVLTFDDALQCQKLNGLSILEERGLPYALSIPTASVDTGKPIWCSALAHAVFTTREEKLSFAGRGFEIPRSPADRAAVHSAIRTALFGMSDGGLVAAIGEILEQVAEAWEAASRHASYRPMCWQDIAGLERCTLVAHSHRHLPFHTFEDVEDLAGEVRESKTRIERATGREVSFFCLPYGCHARDRPGQSAVLAAHGMRGCLTSEGRPIEVRHDRFYLPRIDARRWP